MLTQCTFTGADNATNVQKMAEISARYPFVEWGILINSHTLGRNQNSIRFPGLDWIQLLIQEAKKHTMSLSLHVCGRLVKDIVQGIYFPVFGSFQRVQLNFHNGNYSCDPRDILRGCSPHQEIIFQVDRTFGGDYYRNARQTGLKCYPLFDCSGGNGILPETWPSINRFPLAAKRGYAGGLGPHNLEEQLPLIKAAAEEISVGTLYWIDMESGVRTANEYFDLEKVEQCCKIVEAFLSKQV